MIRCSAIKLGFIHIPKTGGSSITAALAPYSDFGPDVAPEERRYWQLAYHFKSKHMHSLECEGVDLDTWTVAAFTRCPWDRALSMWTFNRMIVRPEGELVPVPRRGLAERRPKKGEHWETFEEFLQRLLDKPHTVSERYRQHGRHQVSFMERCNWRGCFESLDADWLRLAAHVGITKPKTLEHRNLARHDIRAGIKHTERSNELVRLIWPDDCSGLGYSAPSIEG